MPGVRIPLPSLIRRTVSRALAARITEGAAALTYFETMALVPSLVVSLSIASLVVDDPRATVDGLVAQLGGTSEGGLASALREIFSSLSESGNASTLITIGAVTAIWSTSGATSALLGITGRMLGSPDRGILRTRARALALALASALAGAFAVGSVVLQGGASAWLARQTHSTFLSVALERGAYLVIVLGVAAYLVVVYRTATVGPPPRSRSLVVGALVGALLFALGTIALGTYLSTIGPSDAVAGSLAGVIVVLIWMYVSNLAILAGAALCGELDERASRGRAAQLGGAAPRPSGSAGPGSSSEASRSPSRSTRSSAELIDSSTSTPDSTSSQVTGSETGAPGRGRTE